MPVYSVLYNFIGNDVSALGSVPAAVFSFVRCTKPVSHLKVEYYS